MKSTNIKELQKWSKNLLEAEYIDKADISQILIDFDFETQQQVKVEPEVIQLIADITENKLLVRPSLVGGWWVSKWKGVTGLNEAYCNGVIGEGKTILEAVNEWKKLSKQTA